MKSELKGGSDVGISSSLWSMVHRPRSFTSRGLYLLHLCWRPRASTIQVLMEDTAFIDLQGTKTLQQEIRFPNGLLQTAVVRFAVARITQGLKDGLFLEPPTHNTFTVPIEAADFPAIQQLLPEKTCTYQIRQGGNLLCSVAISTNPTRRAQT